MRPGVIVVLAFADSIGIARLGAIGTLRRSHTSLLITTTCAPPSRIHSGSTPGAKVGKITRRGSDAGAEEVVESYL